MERGIHTILSMPVNNYNVYYSYSHAIYMFKVLILDIIIGSDAWQSC